MQALNAKNKEADIHNLIAPKFFLSSRMKISSLIYIIIMYGFLMISL